MKPFETMLVALIVILTIAMALCMHSNKAHSAGLICYDSSSAIACMLTEQQATQSPIEWREISPEQRAEWHDRCKPTIYVDRYGVERYRYAKPGCEYGP